eukprot:c8238_g1_i1 orf=204-1391(+)
MSSDSEVQITALQLLCHMCAVEADIKNEVQILVEEGITDYIFEVLRTSKNAESLVAWSVRALRFLSGAGIVFVQRFPIGFETVTRTLDFLFGSALFTVQSDALMLIATGLSNCPGAVSPSQAERLMSLLTDKLKQNAGEGLNLMHDTFNSICEVLTALLRLPCISSIHDVTSLVETAAESAMTTAVSNLANANDSKERSLKYAIDFLKEAFKFSLEFNSRLPCCNLTEMLLELCGVHLVPIFKNYSESLIDEDTVLAIFETFRFILEEASAVGSTRLAEKLAAASWFSLSFSCVAEFPGQRMKENALILLQNLVEKLDGGHVEEIVKEYIIQLPADSQDLLFLLEQSSLDNFEVMLAQFATISILYTSQLCGDRLVNFCSPHFSSAWSREQNLIF